MNSFFKERKDVIPGFPPILRSIADFGGVDRGYSILGGIHRLTEYFTRLMMSWDNPKTNGWSIERTTTHF